MERLLADGHHVTAIAPADDFVPRLENLGCQFIALPMSGSGVNPVKDAILFLRFLRIVQKSKFDVLLTWTIKPNIYGSLISRVIGVPIICNVSGLGTVFVNRNLVSRIAIFLYKVSVGEATHVFFQNDEDQEVFLSQIKLRNDPGLLNGSGVDLNYFQVVKGPKKESKNAFIFIMIGRLIDEKGVYEFAEAAKKVKAKYPEVSFQLIGKWGTDDKRYVTEKELDLWTQSGILDYLTTSDDVRSVIANVDVVVLPSYREGTPRTLLEGGAMGKALITTDVPGCHHVVEDGHNGFLCEVKSADSLADAMIKYINLSDFERESISINSRKVIEDRFDEKAVINEYSQVIDRIVT